MCVPYEPKDDKAHAHMRNCSATVGSQCAVVCDAGWYDKHHDQSKCTCTSKDGRLRGDGSDPSWVCQSHKVDGDKWKPNTELQCDQRGCPVQLPVAHAQP